MKKTLLVFELKEFLIFKFIGLDDPGIIGLVPMEDGSVRCLTCGKSVSTMRSARRHYHLVHSTNKEDRQLCCQICHKTFAVESYLDDHMRRTHKITKSMMKNRVMPQE